MKNLSQTAISAYAILACLLWSTAVVGIKIGLQYAKPLSFAGMRFILAGLLLVPFCGNFKDYCTTVITNRARILYIGLFQTFFLYLFFYLGIARVSGAVGAIIIGSSPLFVAIAAHLSYTNDKLSLSKTLILGLGIAGVVVISVQKQSAGLSPGHDLAGILLLIGSTIASAIGNIIVSKHHNTVNPLILNSAQIAFGGLLLLVVSLPFEGVPKLIQPAPFYGALGYLAVLSAVAFSIWFNLLRIPGTKVSALNVWKFIIPVSGAILSWSILPDESPTIATVFGMVCIAVSIVFYNLKA